MSFPESSHDACQVRIVIPGISLSYDRISSSSSSSTYKLLLVPYPVIPPPPPPREPYQISTRTYVLVVCSKFRRSPRVLGGRGFTNDRHPQLVASWENPSVLEGRRGRVQMGPLRRTAAFMLHSTRSPSPLIPMLPRYEVPVYSYSHIQSYMLVVRTRTTSRRPCWLTTSSFPTSRGPSAATLPRSPRPRASAWTIFFFARKMPPTAKLASPQPTAHSPQPRATRALSSLAQQVQQARQGNAFVGPPL